MLNADVRLAAFLHAASCSKIAKGCCDILATRDLCIVALICAGAVPLTRYPSFAAMRWREATMYRLQGEGG
jgi:hypothetical protein